MRKCRICNATLSSYNPEDICYCHQKDDHDNDVLKYIPNEGTCGGEIKGHFPVSDKQGGHIGWGVSVFRKVI